MAYFIRLRVMVNFRLQRLALIVMVCFVGLCGCDENNSDSDGKVHVTYWEKWNGFEADAMQKAVDAFNQSQDRIVVEYLSTSEVDRKTILATTGGNPPDIAGVWGNGLSVFADANALIPLDDFMEAEGIKPKEWLARYYPVYADICYVRGKIVAVPTTPTANALHWNKTLFRQAGLDPDRPPRTLEELNEYAEKLTKKDPVTGKIVQMGYLPQEPGIHLWALPRIFGGEIFDGKSPTIATNPGNLKYLQWLRSFPEKYGLTALKEFSGGFGNSQSPQNPFIAGKVAMVYHGVWMNNFIKRYSPGMEYGVAPMPTAIPGMDDFSSAELDVLAIPRGAKHPKEAWEFIKYTQTINPRAKSFEELRGEELICFAMEKNSPLKTWSPYFEQHHPHPYIDVFRRLSASKNIIHSPKIGIWQEYGRELGNCFQSTSLLIEPPEVAVRSVQKRIEKSWAWYLRNLKRHNIDNFTEASNINE